MTDIDELVSLIPDGAADAASLVRVADAVGLGARWPGQAAVVLDDGTVVGSLLGGAVDDRLSSAVPGLRLAMTAAASAILDVELDRDEAERAGLPCAGRASMLVQPLASLPATTLADVAARRPAGLLTFLDDPASATRAVSGGTTDDDGSPESVAAELMRRGEPADALVETTSGRVLVSVFVPSPRLVVVGSGALATALDAQLGLLGWSTVQASTAEDGVAAVRALGPGDGLLVIDHRGEVDFPILSEALTRGIGYVAALGSRRTQEARRSRLLDGGVEESLVALVRGPAGLDLGARTPAEIAVAIVAEMLSVRSSSEGGALRDGSGSINRGRA